MITAIVNAPYSNRIQLALEGWVGPFVRPLSPPVPFDPTDPKVLEVYIDGRPARVSTFSFDSINNRYLLFMEDAFDPSTAVVQTIHHMPKPPYQYGVPVPANPIPAITSLDPPSAPSGHSAQVLTIDGADFMPTSTATYNGVPHTFTYASAGQGAIPLTSGDQAAAGSYPVVVTNPPPGGGASNAVDFSVVSSLLPALYIGDADNGAVRLVDQAGDIHTPVFASADPLLSYTQGIWAPLNFAAGAGGSLYILDANTVGIWQVSTSYVMTRVAGTATGTTGTPVPGPATSSPLPTEPWLAADPSGNLFVGDFQHHRVYAVNMQASPQTILGVSIAAGDIALVAGTGTAGFSGDGGPALSATFRYPQGLACDSSGSLYVCDEQNYCVRKIDTSGNISTVAGQGHVYGQAGDGGLATLATMTELYGLGIDPSGNLYIADMDSPKIRAVNMTGGPAVICGIAIAAGHIDTVAGTGTAGDTGDEGPAISAEIGANILQLCTDASGSLYLTDFYNNRARRVDSGGTIHAFAGTGTAGYSGDGGAATAADLGEAEGIIYLPAPVQSTPTFTVGLVPSTPLPHTLSYATENSLTASLASLGGNSVPAAKTNVGYLEVGGDADILSLDMASFPQLFYLDCHGNSGMASLALAGTYVTYLNANSCALGQASVDAVLVALDGNGLLNGTVNLGGAGNSAPSATGLAAASSLQTSKGWSVTHN